MFLLLAVITVLNFLLSQPSMAGYLEDKYPASVLEDTTLDMFGLTRKYNYPLESHYVTTEDKYILRLFRLPRPKGRPILLMHGLLDSSITWLLSGPWSALGYYLFDLGYDVWMGNARGNFYSRNHSHFNPDTDKSFWQFSWHEIGYYDLPAMIDYVLKQTGFAKLAYFGHSQGTTTFFVMTSTRPDYNEKITVMSALAPVSYMANLQAPLLPLARNFMTISGNTINEFLPRTDLWRTCFISKMTETTCFDLLYQVLGKDPEMWNATMAPVHLAHFPNGCNMKQIKHYNQLIDSGRFCQYDCGPAGNLKLYNSTQPKAYAIKKITAPVALYYTYNDHLSSYKDVMQLAKELPNVAEDCLYPNKKWNHMTMLWGLKARELAHKHMVEVMRKFES
ncbi:PREDICTED: lipase 1 [Rhagoletis zephyria]|uniref:lipase 1 n=1 Tax=Rhagoletis zephyria TaxID=28612 RepID=UPI000811277B|nr:PREDICTED: lipase 1 [Rhagoletis zephyria]